MTSLSYRGHHFPAAIIQHAIWVYLRFTLSYRDVEVDLLRKSGEALAHLAACFAKRAGLVKLRAEWRRTGL